jgi:hypothetical protein
MTRGTSSLLVALAFLAATVAGCGGGGSADEEGSGPVTVQEIAGTDLSRVELTPDAAKRLDIQTEAVAEDGTGKVVPYAAVLYSPNGDAWVYVSRKPLSFVRQKVVVDSIEGDRAFLSTGPAAGTKVATVGVAELFGAESGLGE